MIGALEVLSAHAWTVPPVAKFAALMVIIVAMPAAAAGPASGRRGVAAERSRDWAYGVGLAGEHRPVIEFAAELGISELSRSTHRVAATHARAGPDTRPVWLSPIVGPIATRRLGAWQKAARLYTEEGLALRRKRTVLRR